MAKNNNSLGIYKIILVTLITSLSITGISYLDSKIWNLIMVVIGVVAYYIVGILFSLGLLSGKKAGKEAYAFVFILLLIFGYCVYSGIVSLQNWILSWALWIKILVPVVMFLIIGFTTFLLIYKSCKKTKEDKNE